MSEPLHYLDKGVCDCCGQQTSFSPSLVHEAFTERFGVDLYSVEIVRGYNRETGGHWTRLTAIPGAKEPMTVDRLTHLWANTEEAR